jgi:hypothetical protein
MTNIEIQLLLEQAYEETFLGSVQLLVDKTKDYMRSSFYKNTKIDLPDLFQKYFIWKKSQENTFDTLINSFNNVDTKVLIEKATVFAEELIKNEKFKGLLDKVLDTLDYNKLSEFSEELNTKITSLKK